MANERSETSTNTKQSYTLLKYFIVVIKYLISFHINRMCPHDLVNQKYDDTRIYYASVCAVFQFQNVGLNISDTAETDTFPTCTHWSMSHDLRRLNRSLIRATKDPCELPIKIVTISKH